MARCNDNSLYCGYCTNVQEREIMHNSGKGAKYTRSRLPIHILYSEKHPTKSAALKREIEIKKLPKHKKEELIRAKMAS